MKARRTIKQEIKQEIEQDFMGINEETENIFKKGPEDMWDYMEALQEYEERERQEKWRKYMRYYDWWRDDYSYRDYFYHDGYDDFF